MMKSDPDQLDEIKKEVHRRFDELRAQAAVLGTIDPVLEDYINKRERETFCDLVRKIEEGLMLTP